MSNYESATILADGIRLNYYRAGHGDRSLVLVHGITDDGLCWTPVTEVFADRLNVVMVDLRGHGLSDAPEDGYTLENIGNELAAVIRTLGLTAPIVLGHSLGAIAALVMAGLHPKLPGYLILEDPPPFWDSTFFSSPNTEFEQWIRDIKNKARDEILAEGNSTHSDWSKIELEHWANSKLRFDAKVTALMHPSDYASINFRGLMGQISCPILLLSGNKALGAAATAEQIAQLKEYLPRLQVISITEAGHSIRREQFDQYIAILRDYL